MPHLLVDAVFIAKAIDFVVFVAGITFVYLKWGQPALVAVQASQNKAVEDARTHREEAAESVAQAHAELERAKTDAARMVTVAHQQAERLHEQERSAAQEHAKRVIAHARGELDRERYRARQELLLDTVERAFARATDLARQEIDPATQAQLVGQLMAQLEAGRA